MTRFKPLRRIEAAIEHRDDTELRWALGYCEMRLRIARLEEAQKTWRALALRVRRALAQDAHED